VVRYSMRSVVKCPVAHVRALWSGRAGGWNLDLTATVSVPITHGEGHRSGRSLTEVRGLHRVLGGPARPCCATSRLHDGFAQPTWRPFSAIDHRPDSRIHLQARVAHPLDPTQLHRVMGDAGCVTVPCEAPTIADTSAHGVLIVDVAPSM